MTGVIIIRKTAAALRPIAARRPLSLHKFAGTALIERQLLCLMGAGATAATVIAEEDKGLSDYFAKRKSGAFRVSFTLPKGKSALAFLREYRDALLRNGREPLILLEEGCVTTAATIKSMLDFHKEAAADVTAAVTEAYEPESRVYSVSGAKRVEGVFAPPSLDHGYSDLVGCGAAVLGTRVLGLAAGENCGGIDDLVGAAAEKLAVFAFDAGKEARFIKDAPSYREAAAFFIMKDGGGKEKRRGVISPCYAENAKIAADAEVGPFTQLGDGSTVGGGSAVRNSVIGDGVTIGKDCEIDGGIILDGATVGDGARVCEDAVIGFDAEAESGEVILRGVHVPDFRSVGSGSLILSGDEVFALGKKAGKGRRVIAVGSDAGEEEVKSACLFADGAAAAGATAVIIKGAPECVWRVLCGAVGAESGVYFCADGPLFSDGFDEVERKEPRRESGAVKDLTDAAGLIYGAKVASFGAPTEGFEVSSESEYLRRVYEGRLGGEGGASFYVGADGVSFSLSDEKGIYMKEERTPSLAAFCILATEKTLYLPEGYPLADALLERATGGRIIRDGGEKAALFYDAAFQIASVMKASKALLRPVFSLAAATPRYFIKKESFPAKRAAKTVARLASTETAGTGTARAFLMFDRFRPSVTVTAVGESEEECERILALYK